ncbi:hypothetical protein CYLTODRAFT_447428 [Cylindrobasidium torrendii FP15055 ss-10]|uniref:Uncharacterized protein n=1 Tax=Cylindrobasidium torrendii FP15055 ss-10 TaxID=1314674 RepID=A0A0D7AUZ2_9AGAR|nr:hypothetical protein CYLTODRAFT_447428 [Cylindrobasidium torrendii FP15055 ss-10]
MAAAVYYVLGRTANYGRTETSLDVGASQTIKRNPVYVYQQLEMSVEVYIQSIGLKLCKILRDMFERMQQQGMDATMQNLLNTPKGAEITLKYVHDSGRLKKGAFGGGLERWREKNRCEGWLD